MPFTKKSETPVPPISHVGKQNDWIKQYFNWTPVEGENYMVEKGKTAKTLGEGEDGWKDFVNASPQTPVSAPTQTKTAESKPGPEPAKGEDNITLSRADLETLMKGVEEKLEAKLKLKSSGNDGDVKELVSELVEQLSPTPGNRRRLMKEEDIDREDYLDEPVLFFTYTIYYAIFSEKRYGQEVSTPYGRKIQFTNIATNVQGGAGRNGKQILQISAAQVTTKKEVEWLRNSPKFGVIFFESMKDVQAIDRHRAQNLADAMIQISTMSEHQIMQRALSYGVTASKDAEVMKMNLIKKIADENANLEMTVSRNAASTQDAMLEQTIKRGVNRDQVAANTVAY